jgi:hypothetical protein
VRLLLPLHGCLIYFQPEHTVERGRTARMFSFEELDDMTRRSMLEEFRAEQASSSPPPFRPANLTPEGGAVFAEIMQRALLGGDEQTLAYELAQPSYWNTVTMAMRKGKLVPVHHKVSDLARTLADNEFNTWYVRGLSRRLMDEGVEECEVYRAGPAYQRRVECTDLEGRRFSVREIYAGHRAKYHPVDNPSAFSIPVGVNCHHSIRRIAA